LLDRTQPHTQALPFSPDLLFASSIVAEQLTFSHSLRAVPAHTFFTNTTLLSPHHQHPNSTFVASFFPPDQYIAASLRLLKPLYLDKSFAPATLVTEPVGAKPRPTSPLRQFGFV
jgi:hypothetical protein